VRGWMRSSAFSAGFGWTLGRMAARAAVSLLGVLVSLAFGVFVLHHAGGLSGAFAEWVRRVSEFRP
jgi:hypothetical protein